MAKDNGGPREGEVSITQASFILKKRYLKTRDLATQGLLGEVRRSETGRYYVKREAVEAYKREQEK